MLEDAFVMTDFVRKYTIEGITNIVRNRGVVNLDFNDLRTTLFHKGIGHLISYVRELAGEKGERETK